MDELPEADRPIVFPGGESDAEEDRITGTASPPACDKWSISIEELLADPVGLEVFNTYLANVGRAAALSFWLSCKMYRETCLPKNRLRQAQSIYKQYLSRSAAQNVKIGDVAMKAVRASLAADRRTTTIADDLYVGAQADVVGTMRDAEYPAFLKSDTYREYVAKASRRRLLINTSDRPHSEFPIDENELFSPPFEEEGDEQTVCSFALSATSINDEGSTLSARIRALSAQQNAPKAKDDIQTDGIRAAFQKDDLPELPPVPRQPRKYNYRPEDFFLLLRDRLQDVIRHNELPSCLRPSPESTIDRQQLGNIVEQPELKNFDPDFDVAGHRKPKPYPLAEDDHSDDDLSSCAASLVRSIQLDETGSQQRHRIAALSRLKKKTHVHHHQHVHQHHHYEAAAAAASAAAAAPKLPPQGPFKSDKVYTTAMSSNTSDQWSLASSEPSESLYMVYDRHAAAATALYPSCASSVASYNSREGSDVMVGRQPVKFSCANRDPAYLSPPAEQRAQRMHSRSRGIEITYRLLLPGQEPKTLHFRLHQSTVTLKDFKAYIPGNYRYYFLVYDPSDRQKLYQEYTKDSEFLPVYDGKIEARVQMR